MAKPIIHARSSAKKFWGEFTDYIDIHDLMDSSKSAISDNRHRALTHNNRFLFILEKIFGHVIINSDGKEVSVRDIGEQHILEDYGMRFIPTVQDYFEGMEFKDRMNNGHWTPASMKKVLSFKNID